MTRVVGLGGGIGAARLWTLLAGVLPPEDLTLVVNTADDLCMHGLRVCPDLDTTLYALSGRLDVERGWGVKGDSWSARSVLGELGGETWFGLGDQDLGMHLFRSGLLRSGLGLAAVTGRAARALGVDVDVLPMTEQEVATRVRTVDGRSMHYQEFLVRAGAEPRVRSVTYEGLAEAQPTPGVLKAIDAADVIVIGPSNPVASVEPILGLPGVRSALAARRRKVVAVTPVVSGVPVEDAAERRRALSRTRLLEATGSPSTASAVAARYDDLVGTFVLDPADGTEAADVVALGLDVVVAPTLVHLDADPAPLLEALLGTPASLPATR